MLFTALYLDLGASGGGPYHGCRAQHERPATGELRLVAAAFRGFRYGDVGQSEGVLNPGSFK
jgi:hypothetical protein